MEVGGFVCGGNGGIPVDAAVRPEIGPENAHAEAFLQVYAQVGEFLPGDPAGNDIAVVLDPGQDLHRVKVPVIVEFPVIFRLVVHDIPRRIDFGAVVYVHFLPGAEKDLHPVFRIDVPFSGVRHGQRQGGLIHLEEEIEEILVRETAETGVVVQSVPRGMQSVDSGSIRDDAVIECCDKYHMTLAFTGTRLFHH